MKFIMLSFSQYLNAVRLSSDLKGHSLVKPWNFYSDFCFNKLSNTSGMRKIAWLVYMVATGVFGVLFGFLAFFGMMIKLFDSRSVGKFNAGIEKSIEEKMKLVISGVKSGGSFIPDNDMGENYKVVHSFKLYKEFDSNTFEKIKKAAKDLNDNMRKVYIQIKSSPNLKITASLDLLILQD
jgi:hypothetical protein